MTGRAEGGGGVEEREPGGVGGTGRGIFEDCDRSQ